MTRPTGLRRPFTTLHHVDLARLYLAFATAAGLWGATDAMAIRTELLAPSRAVWGPATYAGFFTTHGLTMLFFFATPAAFGFAVLLVPRLVGADGLAFPRVAAVAFWLLPPALLVARAGVLLDLLGLPAGPPTTGWTLYAPLSVETPNPGIDTLLLGLHLASVSTVATAITLAVTVVTGPVDWPRLDTFTWTVLTTAGLVVFAVPVLAAAILMLLADRNLGTAFFTLEGGGPLLWQHLFWFFGHPEVYIVTLPALGIVSRVLPAFAGRRLFGARSAVYSTLAVGALSFGVWAHHMFATGIDPRIRASFMATSLAIAVPSAAKVCTWLATLWNGRLRLTPPMLCCVGAVGWFVVGGVSGVFLAAVPTDLLFHGTYLVVAHFHFVLVGTVVLALFAAGYYWFPLLAGRRLDDRLARTHVWLTLVGVALTFGPMLALGAAALPRRAATYPAAFTPWHGLATLGAYVLGVAQCCWLANVAYTLVRGPPAGVDPWNLDEAGPLPREWRRDR